MLRSGALAKQVLGAPVQEALLLCEDGRVLWSHDIVELERAARNA